VYAGGFVIVKNTSSFSIFKATNNDKVLKEIDFAQFCKMKIFTNLAFFEYPFKKSYEFCMNGVIVVEKT
jgi:hypothetical protein